MSIPRTIRIAEPLIRGCSAAFAWAVEPATELYRETSFRLDFPESIDLERVPPAIWWRVALICLHSHWALLRPCRVELPVRLEPGERELWMRFCDAQVATLEAHGGGADTARGIEIVELGPQLEPLRAGPDSGITVACFSGGRDSLTQLALLQELGAEPLLVSITSPREGSVEHDTPRRRQVMAEVGRRRDVELVEVVSDFRSNWRNDFIGVRYPLSVNEVTDTFLYTAAALVVAVARGARSVYLASENEVQENAYRAGTIVQHKHYMYSAVSQRVLSAVLEPAGIRCASLTYPLRQFQVQRLLSRRYADLRDLQYSCWSLTSEQSACSRCGECRSIAFNLMAEGVSPGEAGIDVVELLDAQADWRPGATVRDPSLPGASEAMESQTARCIEAITPARMTAFIETAAPDPGRATAAATAYERMYSAVRELDLGPEPGYRAGFLKLLDPAHHDRLAQICDEEFQVEDEDSHAVIVRRTITLTDWIAAPLRNPRLGVRSGEDSRRPPAPIARPPEPARPSAAVLAEISDLIPDPEPPLSAPEGRRILAVSETLLEGNELRYLRECVDTNWISSAGPFVGRFETAFAEVAGCRYGVACSSGTTALHLALAAAGIGPGDEVIVPTFTMIASPNAVGYLGAKPVLVDSDERTWNIDLERIADSIGPRTRAIMIVHIYGHPVDADAVRELAQANDLVVIEDAAEAHGGALRGRPVGSLGDVASFSFYGNKILTTGEGGIVTTNDERIATVARELRDHGFTSERHFWHRFRAFNFRMSNLQAAVGLAQVERLSELTAQRHRVAELYRAALEGISGLRLAPREPGHDDAHWMFGCLVNADFGCTRDQLRRRLAADGIETRCFFVPIHIQPAYIGEHAGRRYPVAERLGRDGLYLPSAPTLSEQEIAIIAESIRRASSASRPVH